MCTICTYLRKTMRRFLPTLLLVLPLAAAAEPVRQINSHRDLCQHTLQGAAFNRFLETSCGFDENVSDKVYRVLRKLQCNGFTLEESTRLSREAVADGQMRLERFGKTEFCQGNRQGYLDAGAMMEKILEDKGQAQ